MDVTKIVVYLENLSKEKSVDFIITDNTFRDFICSTKAFDYVILNGSYLYNKEDSDDYYTFEGFEELLDGIVKLSPNNVIQKERLVFVKKIEECIHMYYLIRKMGSL